jgi:hypothetical protein
MRRRVSFNSAKADRIAQDEALRIEFTAANLATLVGESGTAWLGRDARLGWDAHAAGVSPDPPYDPWRRESYMAGWLARQIRCHGLGDDTAHVCRCTSGFTCIGCLEDAEKRDESDELEAAVNHAEDVIDGTGYEEEPAPAPPVYYPNYVPRDADKFEQMMKMFSHTDTEGDLERLVMLFVLDHAFHREDISIAMGRVARAKGWEP